MKNVDIKKGYVNMAEKISFTIDETNETVEFFVVEETRINNTNYILVTESEDDEEADAYILKDTSDAESSEAVYEIVENDDELEYVSRIFAELLEDIDIENN